MDRSDSECSLEQVFLDVMSGRLMLVRVTRDGDVVGWTTFEMVWTPAGWWLQLPMTGLDPGLGKAFLDAVAVECEVIKHQNHSSNLDFRGARFVSSRGGHERFMRESGWRPRFVEYVLEV